MGYARILAHYPYVVLLVVLVVTATCLVVSITLPRNLDFRQPTAGFEPRGTEIGERLTAYHNLMDNAGSNVNLHPFTQGGSGETSGNRVGPDLYRADDEGGVTAEEEEEEADGSGNLSSFDKHLSQHFDADKYFCGLPKKGYVRVVYRARDGGSLLSSVHLRSICRLEEEYFDTYPGYAASCETPCSGCRACCRRLSLPNFVALLAGKTSCRNLTDDDVGTAFRLLSACAGYYHNLTLEATCSSPAGQKLWYNDFQEEATGLGCPGVPTRCTQRNVVFTILHYLTDHQFLLRPPVPKSDPPLTYVATFLPLAAAAQDNVGLYEHLESLPRVYQEVEITGAYFAVKDILFEKYLVADSVWLGLAAGVIFLGMWLYTTSVFVTFMTFLAIFWALVTAYFLYTFVFEIGFFPYMNMITVVVMIGIGADDLYIYCKVWHLAKSEKNNGVLEKLISDTLRHSVLSMLVTSLTTAAAFFANFVSDITAIRCFSIYAGTTVVCNFVLTVTWMPASIMLFEKWCNFHFCRNADVYTGEFSICYCLCKVPHKLYYLVSDWSRIFFEQILPCLVIKLRYLWLLMYGCLGICSVIVIFYYPRLKLPSTRKFQMFSDDHLLERYDFHVGTMFGFEMTSDDDDSNPNLPITIVWGVHATDDGDYLDPNKKGPLYFDEGFDLTTGEAQRWLLEFCRRLRRTDFYLNVPGMQLTNCFLENFVKNYMKRQCSSDNPSDVSGMCCNKTRFPYPKREFSECLKHYIPALQSTPGVHYSKYSPGPRFNNGHISAFVVQFQSNERYTHDYQHVQSFYRRVNRWVTEEMLRAPAEMRNGWFVSHLDFFDLQQSLVVGTPLALGVSLAVVSVVAFFTTLNVLISLYAITTIACVIVVTLASLVLLGWELNVLESVVITVAIGMAIDYTLHYGVAYRLSPDLDREMRVASSLSRMGSPVAMAALTTFLAGLFMMPSTVLAYRKFGTFLMLLVSVSWVYSTFFFQALLRAIGPQGGFGQFHWPASDCCSGGSREHVDKTVYALSESTLSSSSANHASSTETHELEPLTSLHDASTPRPRYPSTVSQHAYSAHHNHYHHHHHHLHQQQLQQQHRPRARGQYTQVKTRIIEIDNDPEMAEKSEQQQPQQQQQQARRESPAVTFRSSQHLATAVAELDPFRVSEQPEQVGGAEEQRCADSTMVRASVADQRVSDGGVTDCVGLVSADLSHGPFPQAVEVL